jgi:hypothetical protein
MYLVQCIWHLTFQLISCHSHIKTSHRKELRRLLSQRVHTEDDISSCCGHERPRSVGEIAAGPRQHNHSWFQVAQGSQNCASPSYSATSIEVRSYFTTDGRSVSMSWYRAPLWDLQPDIITSCWNVAVWNLRSCIWGALSDERTGLQFTV